MDVEYEPVSLSEGEGPVDNGGDSATSTDEDVIVGSILTATLDDDLALWADDSEDSNSSTTYDPEVSPKDYWTCLQCKCKNNHPMYRYCEKCFRLRKDSFPPRPKPSGKRKMKNNLAQVSSVASSTMSSQFPPIVQEATSSNQTSSDQSSPIVQEITCSSSTLNIMLERTSSAPVMDSNFGSIQDSSSLPHTSALERAASFPMVDNSCGSSYALDTMNNKTNAASEMCIMCLIKPKNGAFIHTKDVHVCCCYDCAVKTWLRHKRCPVCNKKAMNILRVYIV